MRKLIISISALFTAACAFAQGTSFGIIVDKGTMDACRTELEAYRDVLNGEGLQTSIVSGDWKTPDDVKKVISELRKNKKPLEGIVLVGDVPIAMIREAQHMTTAFKMNEQKYPIQESSVASDRFYDDFDLKFEYIGPDTTCAGRHFYKLLSTGTQVLRPDIYSARMKVPQMMVQGKGKACEYQIMRKYLRKVVAAHREQGNTFDRLTYFMGNGYNSDDLNVWRQKALAYREYFPYAFKKASGNRFMTFRQQEEIKWKLFTELQRPGTDLFQFTEHGEYDEQFINGGIEGVDLESSLHILKSGIASSYRRYKGKISDEEFMHEVLDSAYHLNRSVLDPDQIKKYHYRDSVSTVNANIFLDDLKDVRTNARIVILNACYNGSFHNPEGYIAGYHVFGDGDCVLAQGNTVNALQDKMEDKLIGLLSLGIRAGEWHKEVPYLECHLIGDPTFRFAPHNAKEAKLRDQIHSILVNKPLEPKAWKKYLDSDEAILRATAITHLGYAAQHGIQPEKWSDKALEMLKNDGSRIVRVCAFNVLRSLADKNAEQAIVTATRDSYEAIVRYGILFAAEYADAGTDGCVEKAVKKIHDQNPELLRAGMQAQTALRVIDGHPYLKKEANTLKDRSKSDNARIMSMRTFRNNRDPRVVEDLIKIAEDASESIEIRKNACEVLGWYNHSKTRRTIIDSFSNYCKNSGIPAPIIEEMSKTSSRLQNFL